MSSSRRLLRRAFEEERKHNYGLAIQLYEKAHRSGDLEALHKLGKLYAFKIQDGTSAIKYYRQAVMKQYKTDNAYYRIGEIFYNGVGGIEKNPQEAFKSFERGQNASCVYMVGKMLLKGHGTRENKVDAIKSFRKASSLGNYRAMAIMSKLYKSGNGLPTNLKKAKKWAEKSKKRREVLEFEKRKEREEIERAQKETEVDFSLGSVLWVTIGEYSAWPAKIVDLDEYDKRDNIWREQEENDTLAQFFGDQSMVWLNSIEPDKSKQLENFSINDPRVKECDELFEDKSLVSAIQEAEEFLRSKAKYEPRKKRRKMILDDDDEEDDEFRVSKNEMSDEEGEEERPQKKPNRPEDLTNYRDTDDKEDNDYNWGDVESRVLKRKIIRVGWIVNDRNFHDERYIFPVGYKVLVVHGDRKMSCSVERHSDREDPIFKLTLYNNTGEKSLCHHRSTSIRKAWQNITTVVSPENLRDFFGFSHAILSRLPFADQFCQKNQEVIEFYDLIPPPKPVISRNVHQQKSSPPISRLQPRMGDDRKTRSRNNIPPPSSAYRGRTSPPQQRYDRFSGREKDERERNIRLSRERSSYEQRRYNKGPPPPSSSSSSSSSQGSRHVRNSGGGGGGQGGRTSDQRYPPMSSSHQRHVPPSRQPHSSSRQPPPRQKPPPRQIPSRQPQHVTTKHQPPQNIRSLSNRQLPPSQKVSNHHHPPPPASRRRLDDRRDNVSSSSYKRGNLQHQVAPKKRSPQQRGGMIDNRRSPPRQQREHQRRISPQQRGGGGGGGINQISTSKQQQRDRRLSPKRSGGGGINQISTSKQQQQRNRRLSPERGGGGGINNRRSPSQQRERERRRSPLTRDNRNHRKSPPRKKVVPKRKRDHIVPPHHHQQKRYVGITAPPGRPPSMSSQKMSTGRPRSRIEMKTKQQQPRKIREVGGGGVTIVPPPSIRRVVSKKQPVRRVSSQKSSTISRTVVTTSSSSTASSNSVVPPPPTTRTTTTITTTSSRGGGRGGGGGGGGSSSSRSGSSHSITSTNNPSSSSSSSENRPPRRVIQRVKRTFNQAFNREVDSDRPPKRRNF